MTIVKNLLLVLCLAVSTFALAAEKININTADAKTIAELQDIGESRAKAIVAYRNQHGAFKSIEALANVKGIGEKTVEKNKDHMTVGGK